MVAKSLRLRHTVSKKTEDWRMLSYLLEIHMMPFWRNLTGSNIFIMIIL